MDKLSKEGFKITLLDVSADGFVTPEQVANAMTDKTCLVTVMYANNEIGTIQPIKEIGEVCKEMGVIFHTDAVQAAGHLPINVKEENIDLLSLSAHKFHGPKGIGVLYARTGIPLTNIIEGGAQERGGLPPRSRKAAGPGKGQGPSFVGSNHHLHMFKLACIIP